MTGMLSPVIQSIAMVPQLSKRRGKRLLIKASEGADNFLQGLSPGDFTLLVVEYFTYCGFVVEETASETTGDYDLIAVKDREKYCIFCRQQRSGKVGPAEVKDLSAAHAVADATGVIIVTSGEFTADAVSFARSTSCILMGGKELLSNLRLQAVSEDNGHREKPGLVNIARWGCTTILFICVFIGGSLLTDWGKSSFTSLKEAIRDHIELQRLPLVEENSGKEEIEPVRYRYRVELISGAVLFCDNLEIGEESVTYSEKNGLKVTIDRDEISSLKRIKLDSRVPPQKEKGAQ